VSGSGQILLVSGAGVCLAAMVLVIARRGILSMRYTLGWLFVAACLVLGGLFGGVIDHVADALDVEPVAIVLTAVMVGFLGITVQLSISVSGLIELVRTLAESNALLEQRVAAIETARSRTGSPLDASASEVSEAEAASIRVEVEELERGGHEG